MNPTRGCDRAEAVTRASKSGALTGNRTRLPVRRTAASSALAVSRYRRGNDSRAGVLRGQANGQPLTPLFPTATQCFTAPACRHSRTESVRLNAALIAGTIGGLAHLILRKVRDPNGKDFQSYEAL